MKKENYLSFKEFIKIIRFDKSLVFVIIALLFQIPILNIGLLYLFFSFSYIFNDILDVKKDKNRVDKILPKKSEHVIKKLKIINGLILAILLLISYIISFQLMILYIFGIICSIYYTSYLKNFFPSFAIQVWCALAVFISLYQSPHFSIVWFIILYLLFYLREVPLDVRDVKDDSLHCLTQPLAKILK